MKVYLTHSKEIDYKALYNTLKQIKNVDFILPYENSEVPLDSSRIIKNKECDLVLAEVSLPSTGQGIELGWADYNKIPILCIYKKGSNTSRSLQFITKDLIDYEDQGDLLIKLESNLDEAKN